MKKHTYGAVDDYFVYRAIVKEAFEAVRPSYDKEKYDILDNIFEDKTYRRGVDAALSDFDRKCKEYLGE